MLATVEIASIKISMKEKNDCSSQNTSAKESAGGSTHCYQTTVNSP